VTVIGIGSGHTVSMTDAHGETHQHQAIVIRAAGTGNLGNAYHYTRRVNLTLNAGDRSSVTTTYREQFLSTTGGPSYPVAATLHLTVDRGGRDTRRGRTRHGQLHRPASRDLRRSDSGRRPYPRMLAVQPTSGNWTGGVSLPL
jgi:hypothetical protein